MKRILFTAVAALALASPFAMLSASAEQNNYGHHDQAPGQGPQQQGQQGQAQHGQAQDSHDNDGRRHDHRHRWRDARSDARWDDRQHNGYYQNSRWHYGPPPADRYGQRGFALGYRPWARGQRLGYYNDRYSEVDYRSQHLRQPRRGYHWVRDDNGDFLLAAIATGLIAQVILSNN